LSAVWVVAGLRVVSGLVVAARRTETYTVIECAATAVGYGIDRPEDQAPFSARFLQRQSG
jgi:hypothetical protein